MSTAPAAEAARFQLRIVRSIEQHEGLTLNQEDYNGDTTKGSHRLRACGAREGSRATHYVYVLNGPDNETDYRFIGGITADGFYRSSKSPIAAAAPSVLAFAWWWRNVESTDVIVYHAGACGRCGRTLTTPESIRTGLGPICAARA